MVEKVLADLAVAAREAFGPDLVSIVLFGSAAEGKTRPTSDLNVLMLLRAFDPAKAKTLSAVVSADRAAIRLSPMFLLESELKDAAELFAVKFADIRRRHRVLWGADPFATLQPPRAAAINRLRQVLLNQALRLRELYVEQSNYEERLIAAVAEAAGPLRACAAEILELEGRAAGSPKEALQAVAGNPLDELSEARETQSLPPGVAAAMLVRLIDLCLAMKSRAENLT